MALQSKIESPSGNFLDRVFIGLDEVHELLAKPCPVFVVSAERRSKGAILATNGFGAWLTGRANPDQVVTLHGHSVTFEAIRQKRFDPTCNPDFIERLLNLLGQIDPQKTWVPHKELLNVVEQAEESGWEECTESFCQQYRDKLTKRQYPFHIRISDAAIGGDTEIDGHFIVKELKFDDRLSPNHPRRYVLVFDPVSPKTRTAMQSLGLFSTFDPYVYPSVEIVNFIMYNEPLLMKDYFDSLEYDNSNPEGEDRSSVRGEEPGPNELGEHIRAFRLLNELTEKELALKLGVSRAALNHWETGRRQPRDPKQVRKIFEVLSNPMSPHQVFERMSPLGQAREIARRFERISSIQGQISELQEQLSGELMAVQSVVKMRTQTSLSGKLELASHDSAMVGEMGSETVDSESKSRQLG